MAGAVVVVGAGLAGLACARTLVAQRVACTVLEAGDQVGGRVRSDEVDGFVLDRGFQVLLTAYPEAKEVFDYGALDLQRFEPGALVRLNGGFTRISDPWRRPLEAVGTLLSPVGTLADKLRVARLRLKVARGDVDDLLRRSERTTLDALRHEGFSPRMIERFFRPFYGGVQLDRSLTTSSRLFEFTFRMFAEGDTAVPARGIRALPEQLAAGLPPGTLQLGRTVASVEAGRVTTVEGGEVTGPAVVVATDGPTAARLLPPGSGIAAPASNRTTCVYYVADRAPLPDAGIVLDGEGRGPVNNLHVATNVAPSYGPAGLALVSATVVGDAVADDRQLDTDVRAQLRGWFGDVVDRWRHLRTYRIPHAQPAQPPGVLEPPERPVRLGLGLYVCGDHRDNASINGALVSGRRAAEAVLADRADLTDLGGP